MSDDNKVGGLEAKVDMVLEQNSKIFQTVNDIALEAATHRATVSGQIALIEERHADLKKDHAGLDKKVVTLKTAHETLAKDTPSQKKMVGALVIGVPLLGGIFTWVGKVWEAAKHGGG